MGMSARSFHVTCKGEMKMTHVSDFGARSACEVGHSRTKDGFG